jgi:hypothetical protein
LVVFLVNGLPGPTSAQIQTWPGDDAHMPDSIIPVTSGETAAAEAYDALYTLSSQAAALTGFLTLVEAEDRPAQAGEAAELIRTLASRAARVEGREVSLAETLHDLADALEAYAAGSPAALEDVREASAHNAELREMIRDRIGGIPDEN